MTTIQKAFKMNHYVMFKWNKKIYTFSNLIYQYHVTCSMSTILQQKPNYSQIPRTWQNYVNIFGIYFVEKNANDKR